MRGGKSQSAAPAASHSGNCGSGAEPSHSLESPERKIVAVWRSAVVNRFRPRASSGLCCEYIVLQGTASKAPCALTKIRVPTRPATIASLAGQRCGKGTAPRLLAPLPASGGYKGGAHTSCENMREGCGKGAGRDARRGSTLSSLGTHSEIAVPPGRRPVLFDMDCPSSKEPPHGRLEASL